MNLAAVLIAVIGGTGLGGLIASISQARTAKTKAKPEAAAILVDSATDLVVLAKGELERRDARVRALEERLDTAEAQAARIAGLDSRLNVVIAENVALIEERVKLRGEVVRLQEEIVTRDHQITELQQRVADLEGKVNGT